MKLHQLIWSQYYLSPTEQTLGPAQNNPIAQLQTILETVYSYKCLQTKIKILQFYEWKPEISNNFTIFLVYTRLNAIYVCCYFNFSLCQVQLFFSFSTEGENTTFEILP